MDKLKVLYLINYAGKAGTEKYVENLIRHFSDGRAECHFAWNLDGELSEKLVAAGVPHLRFKMRHPLDLAAARTLAKYCEANGIDVIHAQYPRENFIAILSRRWYKNVRVVYTNHLTLRTGALWRVLNGYFTPKNHRIIAVCGEGKRLMIENGVCEDKICVIYNGIEPRGSFPKKDMSAREALGVGADVFMLSILARLAPEKGLGFLLRSLKKLKALTSKPFCCVICGDGELTEQLKGEAAQLGLEGEVVFAGFRRDTEKILLASDLYLNSSECNEALSFAIIEAMNCALPLVVTDVGGNAELARDGVVCGRVVPYGDEDAFAGAIAELMENDALRHEYSQNAFKKVCEVFDLNKLADDVFAAYL